MVKVLENILLSDIGTCPSRAWNRTFEKSIVSSNTWNWTVSIKSSVECVYLLRLMTRGVYGECNIYENSVMQNISEFMFWWCIHLQHV